ncbi:hypothetical protein GY45DRAFT_1317590 [Cubamyces sp. BRFM 1775]|nr:hypothetical protein GY45DRAFT_1317590 [Cubamyces sp. BRFM 1775]
MDSANGSNRWSVGLYGDLRRISAAKREGNELLCLGVKGKTRRASYTESLELRPYLSRTPQQDNGFSALSAELTAGPMRPMAGACAGGVSGDGPIPIEITEQNSPSWLGAAKSLFSVQGELHVVAKWAVRAGVGDARWIQRDERRMRWQEGAG